MIERANKSNIIKLGTYNKHPAETIEETPLRQPAGVSNEEENPGHNRVSPKARLPSKKTNNTR